MSSTSICVELSPNLFLRISVILSALICSEVALEDVAVENQKSGKTTRAGTPKSHFTFPSIYNKNKMVDKSKNISILLTSFILFNYQKKEQTRWRTYYFAFFPSTNDHFGRLSTL
jgi:hypothetical protein